MKNYYKVSLKKVKRPIFYYIAVFIITLNILLFSRVSYSDMKSSENLRLSFANLLRPETKIRLKNGVEKLKIKDYLTLILPLEYTDYFIYTLFLKTILLKKMNSEIKNNLLIYSIDILNKIKMSSLLLDLKAEIYTRWGYSKAEIENIISESLEIDPNLMNHKILFGKNMMEKYSDFILRICKPKDLMQKNAYFNYLIRTKHYKKIVDYIKKHEINLDKTYIDKNMAKNIIKIGDFENSEKLLKNFIKKYKKAYLYYYLYLLYKKNGFSEKALEVLKKVRNFNIKNKTYMLALAREYYLRKEFKKAADIMLESGNVVLSRYCFKFIEYVNKMPFDERENYFNRVKNICDKKIIYKVLSDYYLKKGDREKFNEYNLEFNLIK